MTWYASHIYADAQQPLISTLASHDSLSKGLYLVKDLDNYLWPEFVGRHTMPPNGLVVVRELCAPQTEEARGRATISWTTLEGPPDLDIILPPKLPTLAFGDLYPDEHPESFPPVQFLRFLKALSTTTGTTIAFYHHMLGAGWAVEQEFAWMFGKDEAVYVKHVGKWYCIAKYDSMGLAETVSGTDKSVLGIVLMHYGIKLSSSNFALHTRDFNWQQYRLEY